MKIVGIQNGKFLTVSSSIFHLPTVRIDKALRLMKKAKKMYL